MLIGLLGATNLIGSLFGLNNRDNTNSTQGANFESSDQANRTFNRSVSIDSYFSEHSFIKESRFETSSILPIRTIEHSISQSFDNIHDLPLDPQMSFPNRSTYDEAINDLKRKLQQQQQEHSLALTNSNSNSNHQQSSSNVSESDLQTNNSSTTAETAVRQKTEHPVLLTNGPSFSEQGEKRARVKHQLSHSDSTTKMPNLSTFKADSKVSNDTNDASDTDSESQDESSLVYRNVVNDVRKSAGNSQSDADVLKLMLKERDELLKDYAIKLNEAEMESRANAKKTRSLELERQKLDKQLKDFQNILDDEIRKRDELQSKLSDMQYTMRDLETKASIHVNCDPEKDFLQSSLNEVTDENENLRTSLQSKCELIQTLSNQFENREEMLAESNEQLKSKADDLQRQLIESQSNVDVKTAELSDLKDEVKELKNEIYELMIKVHEKEKMIGAVNDEYNTIQEDNSVLEEKLQNMESELQTKASELEDLREQLKDKSERMKEQEQMILQLQESEVEKKIRQKMRDRHESEQREMQESFKRKLKRETEAAKTAVTKELRHKHLKDLERMRDDLESTHKTEMDVLRKELDEKLNKELELRLKEKESDFKRTMETYQTIIHKLESKVNECNKNSHSQDETLMEVEDMLKSLIKYTSGTSQTIYLDVTALNTTEIKSAFQELTTKIFELLDEIAYLHRQAEQNKQVRQEMEAKLESYHKDFVPLYMYKQVYDEYLKCMKKRDNATSNTISGRSDDDSNLLDVLRSENLQLLEEKLMTEQNMNKLELELTLMKEYQSKTEDYEMVQSELNEAKAYTKELQNLVTSLKDENLFLIDQLESLSESKAKLEEEFSEKQNEVSEELERKSEDLQQQVRSLTAKNKSLSEKLADSVDSETVIQLQEATKELLKQNNELNVENEVLLEEISSVNMEKEQLENQLEIASQQSVNDSDTIQSLSSKSAAKKVQFNLASKASQKSMKKQHSSNANETSREIVLYRPPARDIIEKQLAQENTHLFAVNTKLFSEREKLKEELFQKNMELNEERMEQEKERKDLKQKLITQRLALQRLSSRVRIYSYQSVSPTELELKIKRELMSLEHQITDLLQNFQKECTAQKETKRDRYFLYQISDTAEYSSSSEEEMADDSSGALVRAVDQAEKDEFSDLDEKLRVTQKSIAEKSKEIEAIRSAFDADNSSEIPSQQQKLRDITEARKKIVRERMDKDKGIPPHRNVTTTTMQTLNVVTVTEELFTPKSNQTLSLVQSPGNRSIRSSWRMEMVDNRS